jgi:hypothetical protein
MAADSVVLGPGVKAMAVANTSSAPSSEAVIAASLSRACRRTRPGTVATGAVPGTPARGRAASRTGAPMPFEPTLPADAPTRERASAFEDYLEVVRQRGRALHRPAALGARPPGAMSASLWQDLRPAGDVLEVVAASRRHAQALAAYLRCGERVVPLTLFPQERLAHCPMRLEQFAAMRLDRLRVLHVEPALLRPPGHAEALRVAERAHTHRWRR